MKISFLGTVVIGSLGLLSFVHNIVHVVGNKTVGVPNA